MSASEARLFAVLSGLVVLAGVIAGLLAIGSPQEIRLRRLDEARVGDLVALSQAILSYRSSHSALPQSLSALAGSAEGDRGYLRPVLIDPEGRPYEYAGKGGSVYELCAIFDRTIANEAEIGRAESIFARHGEGRQCFTLDAAAPAQR